MQKYKPHIIEISDVQRATERYFGMYYNALNANTRKTEIRLPRQIAHYWCCLYKDQFRWSLYKIGATIGGLDHATVLHSRKTVQNAIDTKDKFGLVLISEHIDNLTTEINGIYRSKKQKTPMGTGTETVRETVRSFSKNEILSHAGMAGVSQCIHSSAPALRRMFTQQQNNTGQGGRSYKANQSIRSVRYAERQIWRTIKRRKCTIIV